MEREDEIKNCLGHIAQNLSDITESITKLCADVTQSLKELNYNFEQYQKAEKERGTV